jgi:hypothetical protein
MSSPTHADRTRRKGIQTFEVQLADGKLWGFALPGLRLYPIARHESDASGRTKTRIALAARPGYPIEVLRLRGELAAACKVDDADRVVNAFRCLAIALLQSAHDLELTEAKALLDPSRVDLQEIARALIPVVFADASDPSPSG